MILSGGGGDFLFMLNITRSIESYDSVFGMDQTTHLTVTNKPFNNELSSSESVRILKELLMEYNVDDSTPYTHSNENIILDFFGFIIDLIGKILKGIRNFFAKIFGYKTDNEKINDIQRELVNKKSENRKQMIERIKNALHRHFGEIYEKSTSERPVFPNLSKFKISYIDRKTKSLLRECDDVFRFLSTAGWGRKVPNIEVNRFLPLSELYKVIEQFETDGKRFTSHKAGMFISACEFDKFGMWEYFYDNRADDIIKYYVKEFDNVKDEIYNWSKDMNRHLKYWQNTLSDIKSAIIKNRSTSDRGQNDKQVQIVQKWTTELVQAINKLITSQVNFVSVLVLVNIDISLYNNSTKYLDNVAESNAKYHTTYHQHRIL